MFGIGFFEILVIFLVAILLLDQKQLKEYIKLLRVFYQKVGTIRKDFFDYIHSLEETDEVLGQDGKVYKAYHLDKNTKKDDSSNPGG